MKQDRFHIHILNSKRKRAKELKERKKKREEALDR